MNNLLSQEKSPFRIVGGFDAVSCKLIELAGFDGIWASGLCISASLGVPDANIMSFDTFLQVLRTMGNSAKIPIIADCDSGYGDFHNVIYIVKELCKTGICGFCIEDKMFPKINSYSTAHAQDLEKAEVFATKIRAASEQKLYSDFLVIARIESLISGTGMSDALDRACLYQEAGADAIVIHSKKGQPDEILTFVELWENRLPVVVIPTSYPTLTISEIRARQIAGVIFANQPLRASIMAMRNYLAQLSTAESISDCTYPVASVNDIFSLQSMDVYQKEEALYREPKRKTDPHLNLAAPALMGE